MRPIKPKIKPVIHHKIPSHATDRLAADTANHNSAANVANHAAKYQYRNNDTNNSPRRCPASVNSSPAR